MRKKEFLAQLASRVAALPRHEVEERLAFYSEMIDDRIEAGLAESAAVAALGSVDAVAARILAEAPSGGRRTKVRARRRYGAGTVCLLVLGSPIWLSLAIAAFAVVLSLYVVLWSVVISLWAVFASLVACAPVGVLVGIGFAAGGSLPTGVATVGMGCICAGLAVFFFFGCHAATRGCVCLTRGIVKWIADRFAKKEDVSCVE